jgi:hypothetical protein
MKSYGELKQDFEKKVEMLQESCKHKRTKWYNEEWAFAHSTGRRVRVCLKCNKNLEYDPKEPWWSIKNEKE